MLGKEAFQFGKFGSHDSCATGTNLKICAANVKSVLHSTKMRELVMVDKVCYLDFEKDVARH